jgi:hypothetical protein
MVLNVRAESVYFVRVFARCSYGGLPGLSEKEYPHGV